MARIRLLGVLPGMSGQDVERGLVSLFRTDPIRLALCHPLMANHARSPRLSRVNAHWATDDRAPILAVSPSMHAVTICTAQPLTLRRHRETGKPTGKPGNGGKDTRNRRR